MQTDTRIFVLLFISINSLINVDCIGRFTHIRHKYSLINPNRFAPELISNWNE